ncbi:hypothetical protein L198_00714 [Cryptococcus wingfieldii CBS 7118]|uniref:NAD-dependent epimerase/dehydratase domain-containing protein n=1 Tax=Cryptococcus wingfieldii CBS 7118 TaxID=1295528 RepID=A0A1E3K712_9TREE|nr:hypothetical protein L198_00714 [Cryptococcus wingfieldii CBS 7118]ODO08974.1 hypothetical protein L198_00714 [Cryptococcus wingfieldii CBS 7118]
MPLPPPTVAITGLTGFIATHTALAFLTHNWSVRASVRSPSKAQQVKNLKVWERYLEEGRLEVVVVEDLGGGELGGLLEGVEGVAHLAAPLGMTELGWEGYKKPTIDGMLNILKQAKSVPSIRGISVMSSMSALYDILTPEAQQDGKIYTEDVWTPLTEEVALDFDPEDPKAMWIYYGAAKRLAEEAALAFVEEEKPRFSVATFCPPMVYAPFQHISSLSQIANTTGSPPIFASLLSGRDEPLPSKGGFSWVDARDVGEAFFRAVDGQVSGRFVVSAGKANQQIFVNKLRELRPDLDEYIIKGEPSDDKLGPTSYIDATKSKTVLGLEYRPMEETLKDTVDYLEKIGAFEEAPGAWKKDGKE